MRQIRSFGDGRQLQMCAYCGASPNTRDHVPSRVLLDEPYPTNLPVVPACRRCNEGFSADEEYLACVVESVVVGTADPSRQRRPKIARLLSAKPALAARIAQGMNTASTGTVTSIEEDRVSNAISKLARGHSLYEQHEPQHEQPHSIWFRPLVLLTDGERSVFESVPGTAIWPEVGSRAMQRLVEGGAGWIVVQPGRYRYLTAAQGSVLVRGVLSEYLAFEVIF